MPLDLERLQLGFRDNALLSDAAAKNGPTPPDLAALAAGIVANGLPAERRLAVHRNHFAATLVGSLGEIFEATRALFGETFFDAFALRFARSAPPRSPCHFEYGADFPAALAAAPELADHAYGAALARLEWAMHESFHAPAAPALNPTRLAAAPADRVGDVRLRLHPTLRILAAPFPVDDLWRGARGGEVSPDMLQGPETCLLLLRPDMDVRMERISGGLFALLEMLAGGATLGQAASSANFDFGETLGDGLGRGVFADEIGLDG